MFGPQFPQLWRPIRRGGTPSLHDYSSSADYTFGLKACVVDFFGHDYITKFAPLEDLLRGRVDEIMEEAYKHDATSELYLPYTAGGYKFRWIHIPANNMVCLILRACCILPVFGGFSTFPDMS
jgi:hypothetical protein